jgi:formylglycine-generating enzyme required for sulfatase activity
MTDWPGAIPGPGLMPAIVTLPAGSHRVGEPGEERTVELREVRLGRWPVTNAQMREFCADTRREAGAKLADPLLADHPATDVSLADAEAYCGWLGPDVRLPTGDEWEAVARGAEALPFPWGEVFEAPRCNSADSGWGWTTPVTAHPEGASPFGAEQMAGNVWEWVSDRRPDGWGTVRGGSYLDTEWGLRCSRALAADPYRPTATTGFRIAIDPRGEA